MADNHPAGRDPAALRNTLDVQINPATEEKQDSIITSLGVLAGLVTSSYDYISVTRTDGFITGMVFKTGGSSGTTVATLTIARDSNNKISSITKT
jgi:hypothetical protein